MAGLQTKVPGLVLLTDPTLATATAWGVHLTGADEPSPGTFVVRGGVIRYQRLEERSGDWPTYAELSSALQ